MLLTRGLHHRRSSLPIHPVRAFLYCSSGSPQPESLASAVCSPSYPAFHLLPRNRIGRLVTLRSRARRSSPSGRPVADQPTAEHYFPVGDVFRAHAVGSSGQCACVRNVECVRGSETPTPCAELTCVWKWPTGSEADDVSIAERYDLLIFADVGLIVFMLPQIESKSFPF